jgi:DNA mismatch repair protein MutH
MSNLVERSYYKTVDQIVSVGHAAIGKQLEELGDPTFINSSAGKGKVGDFIEVNLFHIPNDSKADVDFPVPHVELKATGAIKDKKNKLKAKERLVIDMINFDVEPYLNSFDDSEPWDKIRKTYLIVYEYIYNLPTGKFRLIGDKFFDMVKDLPAGDLAQMRRDWLVIRDKLRSQDGADSLSEGDTIYLAACTKGRNKEDTRVYKYNGDRIISKRRAFSLKNSYVTHLIKAAMGEKPSQALFTQEELASFSFEQILKDRFKPYVGLTDEQIAARFSIEKTYSKSTVCRIGEKRPKQSLASLASYMAGLNGKKVETSEEFVSANMDLKTIKVEKTGSIKENISFPAESFTEAVETDWEDSEAYQHFHMRFCFCVFQFNGVDYVFKGIRFWTMPEQDIEKFAKPVYDKFVSVLKEGNIVSGVSEVGGKTIHGNNFPKTVFNHVIHVRPHGTNFAEQAPLPVPDKLTGMTSYEKQGFWMDNHYVSKVFKDLIDKD